MSEDGLAAASAVAPFDMAAAAATLDPSEPERPRKARVLPLFAMLDSEAQAKVFGDVPKDTRLVVVSTNVAETSITIPGIRYVVDCGRQSVGGRLKAEGCRV